MGTLIYGTTSYEIEDRLLAHLKIAIAAQLRTRESFLLNWQISSVKRSGRVSVWIDASVPLQFPFGGSRAPTSIATGSTRSHARPTASAAWSR